MQPAAVDLFSGCGAVSAALTNAGFRVVAAVDNDPVACKTYRANHQAVHLYEDDIADVNPEDVLRQDLSGAPLAILVACAPCQPFSSQNQNWAKDHRATLLLQVIKFAKILRPRLILFENVPGLTLSRYETVLTDLKAQLTALGYRISDPVRLDAADYGVPQRRIRCLMIASHIEPPPSIPLRHTSLSQRVTVRTALAGLSKLSSGERDGTDSLHFARKHQDIVLSRLARIPKDGGSRDSLPSELWLRCHIGHRGHPDVYGRMQWDNVAPTLTTGCTDLTRGRFAHPTDDRAITLREAARLQTFPDDYRFVGRPAHISTQIGNAVPIKFLETILLALKSNMLPCN